MCQRKMQKKEFCDSVYYKIPHFTDSCEFRILHDSVTWTNYNETLHEYSFDKISKEMGEK